MKNQRLLAANIAKESNNDHVQGDDWVMVLSVRVSAERTRDTLSYDQQSCFREASEKQALTP